jgi:hypothetical protein
MATTVSFGPFTSSEYRASEILDRFDGTTVTLTFDGGDTMLCDIVGTAETPDNDPLMLVRRLPLSEDGIGHVFACDIVQVEGVGI